MRRYIFVSTTLTILMVVLLSGLRAGDPNAKPKSLLKVADGKLVVHEWGTFTTFSGSDGVFMDFRPLAAEHSDLPYYVLDRGAYSTNRWRGKSRLWGRVRMETPVTYFYTDRARSVNVRVGFPEGLLTEFYPPVSKMLPAIDNGKIFGPGEEIGNSSLDWGTVDLIPVDQLLPNVENKSMRETLTANMVDQLLPHGANEQHYAAARDTDSALVHVRGKAGIHKPDESFFEKFLFYRGVGKFQLPISARFDAEDVVVSNDGDLPMNSAILIHVDGDKMYATKIDQVRAGQTLAFNDMELVSEDQLAALVQKSLVGEGLYDKEAASMVKTWQQSWFTENGTRVLYMVPARTTDELLPLHVTPRPQETLRVLVGRMEIMSPEDEQRMTEAVAASSKAREQYFAQPVAKGKPRKPYRIPSAVNAFGRMAEPALARIRKISSDPVVKREAELLIAAYQR